MSTQDTQHTRYNPLKDEWILVSPHRLRRPWQGKIEKKPEEDAHDPTNALCPGAVRSNGTVNPMYKGVFCFDNDFPALQTSSSESDPSLKVVNHVFYFNDCNFVEAKDEHPLLKTGPAEGKCRVMCFHHQSNMSLPLMDVCDIIVVINEWIKQSKELSALYKWVQIFENKGELMGCSNPHPHCQIWASNFIPSEAHREDIQQRNYFNEKGSSLLLDYAILESEKKVRVVVENQIWVALVPFWATWPYELLLIPKVKVHRIDDLNEDQIQSLASIMKIFLTKYDNLFEVSFPYSMGWHGAPSASSELGTCCRHWQLHAHYYPPLLRSASVKKHMVGYEMLAQAQRDITAENAAKRLRNLSDIHYKNLEKKE